MSADTRSPNIEHLRSWKPFDDFPGWSRTAATNTAWRELWVLDDVAGSSNEHPGVEQPPTPNISDKSILTRKTNPFLPARVDAVLAEIKIGDDLTESQRNRLVAVLREHADCFALSMSEVTVVAGAEHKLNIPDHNTAKFRTNPRQRPLSTPQKIYLNSMLDKMLDAEVIAPIYHRDVTPGASTKALESQVPYMHVVCMW
jgi:hypothetical protein